MFLDILRKFEINWSKLGNLRMSYSCFCMKLMGANIGIQYAHIKIESVVCNLNFTQAIKP